MKFKAGDKIETGTSVLLCNLTSYAEAELRNLPR